MSTKTCLISIMCGIAAGAVAGTAGMQVGSRPLGPHVEERNATALERNSSGGTRAESGENERLVRLFSAYQEPMEVRRNAEVFEALQDLQAADFPLLAERSERLEFDKKNALLPLLLDRWFAVDPAAAEAWMLANPRVFHVEPWARANPEGAIKAALAKPADNRTGSLLLSALRELYKDDFAARIRRINSLPNRALRDEALASTLEDWSEKDPAAALAAVGEIQSPSGFEQTRESILERWAERDPTGALAELGALVPELKAGVLGNPLVTNMAQRLASKHPKLVLDWLATLPAEFRTGPAIAAARTWATNEPIAALEWCMANEVDIGRVNWRGFSSWQEGVLGAAMREEAAKTAEWVEALPAGPDRQRLLEQALRESLWRTPYDKLFSGDPPLALRLFHQLEADGQIAKAATLGEKRGSHGDFTDLGEWARNFPPGEARSEAVAGAMSAAAKRDASIADTLLASAATAADRDAALRGLTEVLSDTAPATAASRALSITDQGVRREAVGRVVQAWLSRDHATAAEWLRNAEQVPQAWKTAWIEKQ